MSCPIRSIQVAVAPLDASPLPLDLALVKQHCAIDGNDMDALLTTYILAAIDWAENAMHRTIYERLHHWQIAAFPLGAEPLRLPRGRCAAVHEILYFDSDDGAYIMHGAGSSPVGTDFQENLAGDDGGYIMPARGETWPAVDGLRIVPVEIEFTAGWPVTDVPQQIIHALLFAVADMVDTRGSADLTTFGKNLTTRNALISPFNLVRFYAA